MKQAFLRWRVHAKQRRIAVSQSALAQESNSQIVYSLLEKKNSRQLKLGFELLRQHARKMRLFRTILSKLDKQIFMKQQRGWEAWKNFTNTSTRMLEINKIFGLTSLERSNKQWAFLLLKQAADTRLLQIQDILVKLQNATKGKLSLAFLKWKQQLESHTQQNYNSALPYLFELLSNHLKNNLALTLERKSSLSARKEAFR